MLRLDGRSAAREARLGSIHGRRRCVHSAAATATFEFEVELSASGRRKRRDHCFSVSGMIEEFLVFDLGPS